MEKDYLIKYGFIINVIILLLFLIMIFFNVDNDNIYFMLQTFWYLSFGWLCGRISNY